ncbi:hypothetical protein TrVE_jg1398 [Triparma verrucosa]|uniref:Aminopeptidase n=1 Tax=Triparma verrucosa TaxID=1606542 RepID=A0A9W7FNK7_9STRA|nr:hypothetical protein TrVE_jg1398 [Triparma verrucosa]
MSSPDKVLLPPNVDPIRYSICLTPDLEKFTYEGTTTVSVNVTSPTTTIHMHAKELSFWSATYTDSSTGVKQDAKSITVQIKETVVIFTFPTSIKPGSGSLHIVFSGLLNNQMAGFYRSGYTDIHGVRKIMASTQFESLDARRAFPCWDEPSRKSIFSVTLNVPVEFTAFSNMPELSCKTLEGGKIKEIVYMDTPVMSSYLVAFCIGEFDYVQSMTENGVLVRVYTPPGKSSSGTFALECACKTLDLYDGFFGVEYPLPKLDMVGIPEFAMGAMENWGLVTYREVDVLVDPIKASSNQKQRVCTVVTHELAHQWFGNLVTMAWWDDLWLNEGFASWTENMAADEMFPDWKMWEQYTVDHGSAALRLDSLRSSHPIQVPIKHAEEVEEVFDAISYCKGSYVVRMIHAVLGREMFQKGLILYMQKHKYGNTLTSDLWAAWEEASGMPIADMMKSWTEQMGYPVLKVVGSTFEGKTATIKLEQSWFLADGSEVTAEEAKLWCIPILASTSAGTSDDINMMREDSITIKVPIEDSSSWVKLNAEQQVPMRVAYDSDMLQRLTAGISSKKMGASDRAGILLDSYNLVKAGMMKPGDLVKLLSSYVAEDDATVWEALGGVLVGLEKATQDIPMINANIKSLAKKIIAPLVELVGWEAQAEDGHLTKLLRGTCIRLLSIFSYSEAGVKDEANRRFAKFLEDAADMQSLPSDMRTPVFKMVVKNGGKKEFEDVKGYYTSATDNAEKKHVLSSIGETPDLKLKMDVLDWTTHGDVKLQDFFYAVGSVHSSGPEGRDLTWTYFKENFDRYKTMLGLASASLFDAIIQCSCGGFSSDEKADEIEEFFKDKDVAQNQRKITQIVEAMRANAKYLKVIAESELGEEKFWKSL